MSKQIEALKLALEALEYMYSAAHDVAEPAITAIREALAEQPANVAAVNTSSERVDKTEENVHEQPAQQQEPVAWMKDCADFWEHYTYISEASQENYKAEAQMWVEKLRTSPQPIKPWVGLTEKEVYDLADADPHGGALRLYRAIEAKLKEKNA